MTTLKKEFPYRETPYVETIKQTLIAYDYPKLEARYLAREIASNLDRYSGMLDNYDKQRAAMANVPFNKIIALKNQVTVKEKPVRDYHINRPTQTIGG